MQQASPFSAVTGVDMALSKLLWDFLLLLLLYLDYSVLYCLQQLCTMMCTHTYVQFLQLIIGLGVSLAFYVFFCN